MDGSSGGKGIRNPAAAAGERAARAISRSAQSSGAARDDVLMEAASRKRVRAATSPPSTPEAPHGEKLKVSNKQSVDSSDEDELSTAGAIESSSVEARGGSKLKQRAACACIKVQEL